MYGVDSADLTTAAYLLGISHPPGAPAYLLLGHLFTWLPFGDVGYRVNLYSAVAGALACFFVYRVVMRLGGDAWLALATSWLVASSYYVWTASVAAEVYAPQACLFAALVAVALRWRTAPTAPLLCLLCFLAGLGLGIHLSLVLALPGLAVIALPPPPFRPSPRLLLAGVLCGLLGAAVYAYLPLRYLSDLPLNPARDYWHVDLTTAQGLWWMISGEGFRSRFAGDWPPALSARCANFAYLLWSNFLGLPVLLGLLGIAAELRQRPRIHLGLLLILFGNLVFYLAYGAGDRQTMIVPAYLVWGIWIGFGARAAARAIAAGLGLGDAPLLAPAVLGCVVALLVLVNYRFIDASHDRSARERGDAILSGLDTNAVFVGAWSDLRLVEYFQHVEGVRRDIQPDDTFFVPDAERKRRIAAALQTGRPVYVTACRDLPAGNLRCDYQPDCQCYRLR